VTALITPAVLISACGGLIHAEMDLPWMARLG